MKKLDKLYREAPKVKSPSALDDRLLRVSRSHTMRQGAKSRSRWWGAGYAVSYLCIFGVGLGVLLQAGFFPHSRQTAGQPDISQTDARQNEQAAGDTTSSAAAVQSDTVDYQQHIAVPEDASSLVDQARAERREVPLVIENTDTDASSVQQESVTTAEAYVESSTPEPVADLPAIASSSARARLEPAQQVMKSSERSTQLSATPQVEMDSTIPESASVSADGISAIESGVSVPISGLDAATNRSAEWLLSRSPDLYTIQIAMDKSADHLSMLADGLYSRLSVSTDLVPQLGETPGWLLLYGAFDSRQQAVLAMSELESLTGLNDRADVSVSLEAIQYRALQRRGR